MRLEDHPTVKKLKEKNSSEVKESYSDILNSETLKQIALDCGADDTGIIQIERYELDDQREEILSRFPWTKSILSFVRRMSVEPIRSPARSVANIEMHYKVEDINHISGKIVEQFQKMGIRSINPAGGFPMEMNQYPNRIWVVAHKPIAVAAGLGHMGIHRNVIHPIFGNFILIGSILFDREVDKYDYPVDYNPCLECNLCVAACPVGAISPKSEFNFTACYTHNYREFMGGFNDWIEQIVDSKNISDYRSRIDQAETSSFWQSLSFGPSYKSAYCLAVCPAGEEVISPYLDNKKRHFEEIVKPLQEKVETVYVVPGSDSEHVAKKFKNKTIKHASAALNPNNVRGFIGALPYIFQKDQSEGLDAVYHFIFNGKDKYEATVVIKDKTIETESKLVGKPDLTINADSETWLGFLAKEKNLVWALISRKVKLKGSPLLLLKFGKCFPSSSGKHKKNRFLGRIPLVNYSRFPFLKNDKITGKISKELIEQPGWSGKLLVNEISQETHNVKTFRLFSPNNNIPFTYLPGQFLTLTLYPDGKRTNRSYTIASTPSRPKCLEITVKREEFGLISKHLHDNIKEGDEIEVKAPNGNFSFTGKEHENIVLIGGGVGITPMMSKVRFLTDNNWDGEIYLILSFKNPEDYIFRNEIEELRNKHKNLNVFVTMSDKECENWQGEKGRLTKEKLNSFVPDITNKRAHICGPVPMMDAIEKMLEELNVPGDLVFLENFGTDLRNPVLKQQQLGEIVGEVKFLNSNKTAKIHENQTILDLADNIGIEIDNACRSGTCGSCKVKLLSGSVTMECEDALTEGEKNQGIVLGCQAKTKVDLEVDV